MKKIGFLAVLSLCVAGGMKAQEAQPVVPEENKPVEIKDVKDINELKKSEQYVYGEVIEMLTDENENVSLAQQKSIAKMQTHVIEIFGERLKMDKKDVQEIWDVIDDKCQNVVIKKGDLLRVLTYIAKDAIFGTKSKKQGDIEEWFPEKETVASTPKTTVISIPVEPEVPVVVVADTVKTTVPVTDVPKDTVKVAPVPPTPVPPMNPTYRLTLNTTEGGRVNGSGKYHAGTNVTIEAIPSEGFDFNGWTAQNGETLSKELRFDYTMEAKETTLTACFAKKPEPVVEVEVPAFCRNLLEQKTFKRLMSYLSEGKKRHELMFGNVNTMQNIDRCYVVVVDRSTESIITVLDKGEGDRMNFTTKKTDRYTNYKGGNYAVIFVQEY